MEVTFWDNEVIIGSTQSYRAEGEGFSFNRPIPGRTNLSVFVAAAGVRQIRFLSPEQHQTDRAQRRRGLNRKAHSQAANPQFRRR